MSACRRFVVVIAILAAAFVTLQPFSRITVFVAAGLYLLYEVGIVFAKVAARRRNKQSRHDNEETLALAG
jgi:Sec-independent protein secretion pathway component TatC